MIFELHTCFVGCSLLRIGFYGDVCPMCAVPTLPPHSPPHLRRPRQRTGRRVAVRHMPSPAQRRKPEHQLAPTPKLPLLIGWDDTEQCPLGTLAHSTPPSTPPWRPKTATVAPPHASHACANARSTTWCREGTAPNHTCYVPCGTVQTIGSHLPAGPRCDLTGGRAQGWGAAGPGTALMKT